MGQERPGALDDPESWLGRPFVADPSLDAVVLRYSAAFGPASAADETTWCRLTGLRQVVERLRPQLVTFRDERGRELFDLPDAPRRTGTPAPVRFLPEVDNALLPDDDRSRLLCPELARRLGASAPSGTARCSPTDPSMPSGGSNRRPRREPRSGLPKRVLASIAVEGRRPAGFLDAEPPDVRLVALNP